MNEIVNTEANDATGPRVIGIVSNPRHIIAWNYKDGLDVRVTADRLGPFEDGGGLTQWRVDLSTTDGLILSGVATCGRWCMDRIVRGLRNALTSRKLHVRKSHENRKARREDAEATGATKEVTNEPF